jgi:two-component system nitrate/nitrite sensor histidine kinase NarX
MEFFRQRLSTKLVWVAITFLVVALAAIGFTLLESWKLEGGAAVINDMGSERMRSYRIAYLLSENQREPSEELRAELQAEMKRLERVLAVLKRGDPARPLVLPRDPDIVGEVEEVGRQWATEIRPLIAEVLNGTRPGRQRDQMRNVRAGIEGFVQRIDKLVFAVERHNARNIDLLRYMQFGLVALAVAGTVALIYLMFLLVVRPVASLHEGMQRMTREEFDTRLPVETGDEFGELAAGFNRMAGHLRDLYTTLEQRVAEKTRDLGERNRELAALYAMTTLLNEPAAIEDVCRGFLRRLMELFAADAAAVRLIDVKEQQIHLYAYEGLAPERAEKVRCLEVDKCRCVESARHGVATMQFPSADNGSGPQRGCGGAGFRTMSVFGIRFKRQLLGLFNLYFREPRRVTAQEERVLETLGQHLGVAIENQRLVSRDRELAVFEERNLLAQELHDSIAQSLAFLNIQAQMLDDSLKRGALGEASEGVVKMREGIQESYDDMRELLLHFRTRVSHEEDMDLALRNMLERFEGQTGIKTAFQDTGRGVALSPESQLQVLHILQEALSNVRKHSGATAVTLEMERGRGYCFRVRDNGRGFDVTPASARAESHIGLRIMRERAHRIGGNLVIDSHPGGGTEVVLTVPARQEAAA